MEKRKLMVLGFFLISLTFALTACGGGGGGGGGGDQGGGGIVYTGRTDQATIDSNNSEILATGAYQGGAVGTAGSLGAVQKTGVDRPYYLDLALVTKEAILQIDLRAPSGIVQSGAIVSESGTIFGECGGQARYAIQYDDVTGDFSGTLIFNSYCSQGITLTGSASFSGKYDLQNDRFLQFSLSYDNMAVSIGIVSFTIKMTITFNYQTYPARATMNILMRDGRDGKVYWVDYSMSFWEGSNYVEFTVSGKSYHPDYGYVLISTPTAFRIYYGGRWPSQGVMILDGKTGIGGGSTKARLAVTSSTTYRVEADTNGDGIYDWDSGNLTWS